MANNFFDAGLNAFARGDIAWKQTSGSTIKVTLTDLNDFAKQITDASNATPIVITSNAHGFANGDRITIIGVQGNTAANGTFRVANQAANTFELVDPETAANIAGNGAYTTGGQAVNLTQLDNIDDIPAGARVATQTLSLLDPASGGVLDAGDVTFPSVSGDASEALLVWKDSGVESTSTLILLITEAVSLPVTPDGNNINVTWDNGQYKIARI